MSQSAKSPQPQPHASGNTNTTSADDSEEKPAEPEGGYPEQKHAGAVGLGPEYGKGATGGDKFTGWKEEIEGKILHNPAKVQHGRDMRTGELKKREKEDDPNPFVQAPKAKHQDKHSSDSKSPQPNVKAGTHTETADKQAGGAQEASTGSNEKGTKEQAATTAPEGTNKAETQSKGEATSRDKQID